MDRARTCGEGQRQHARAPVHQARFAAAMTPRRAQPLTSDQPTSAGHVGWALPAALPGCGARRTVPAEGLRAGGARGGRIFRCWTAGAGRPRGASSCVPGGGAAALAIGGNAARCPPVRAGRVAAPSRLSEAPGRVWSGQRRRRHRSGGGLPRAIGSVWRTARGSQCELPRHAPPVATLGRRLLGRAATVPIAPKTAARRGTFRWGRCSCSGRPSSSGDSAARVPCVEGGTSIQNRAPQREASGPASAGRGRSICAEGSRSGDRFRGRGGNDVLSQTSRG